jgi:GDP-4-dehydro-6-deoxy-D-mannose reductase
MNTVLVTGANGFVGSHLVQDLTENGYRIVGVGGKGGIQAKSSHISQHLVLDLTQASEAQTIDFKRIDYVVHLAGLAAVGDSLNKPMKYIQTNMGIELNLFEVALSQNCFPKFLIISSGSLYDPQDPLPLSENSKILPTSPYAVSKIGQEELSRYYMSRGFECIIARPFNHIGPGQGPGFIVPDLARQIMAAKRHDKKDITVGNLDTKRDYTDVRDIVRAYRLLLEKGKPGEIYNVCSGKSMSGNEIFEILMATAGIRLKAVVDKTKLRPTEATDIFGSHEKITRDTGWKPEIQINKTLKDVLQTI